MPRTGDHGKPTDLRALLLALLAVAVLSLLVLFACAALLTAFHP
jgi:hypothetical protein